MFSEQRDLWRAVRTLRDKGECMELRGFLEGWRARIKAEMREIDAALMEIDHKLTGRVD